MSLISDALKKAQQEREKVQGNPEPPLHHKQNKLYSNKRLLVYVFLVVIMVLAVVMVTLLLNPNPETGMKALNIRENPPTAGAVALKKEVKGENEEKPIPEQPKVLEKEESPPAGAAVIPAEPKSESADRVPVNYIKSAGLVAEDPQHLKFEIQLADKVEYRVVPVEETPGRLAIDLVNTRSDHIYKPINRLNVKTLRGSYNQPAVFRLVFDLEYLDDYKVSSSDNLLSIEFLGKKQGTAKREGPAGKAETTSPTLGKVVEQQEQQEKDKNPEELPTAELIRQGDELAAGKKLLQAVEKYKAALKIEKTVELYLKLYNAFNALDNAVLARAYIDDGLKYFPEDFYLNKISAVLYIRAKEFPRALEMVKRAIDKNAGDYTLFTYQGLCYFHGKDYQNALVSFQKSLDLDSDAVENYYYMGLIFDNQKQYPKALEYYNVFFKLNPDHKNFKHKEWILRRMKILQDYLSQQ